MCAGSTSEQRLASPRPTHYHYYEFGRRLGHVFRRALCSKPGTCYLQVLTCIGLDTMWTVLPEINTLRINGGFRCLVGWYGLGEIAWRELPKGAMFPWCQSRLWDQRNGGWTRIQSVSNTFKITKTTLLGVQERAATERPTAEKPMWS